jgi:hypothetical protein
VAKGLPHEHEDDELRARAHRLDFEPRSAVFGSPAAGNAFAFALARLMFSVNAVPAARAGLS